MAQGTLVVGTITSDYVTSPGAQLDGELGGSATYYALAARHFGPVHVVAPVGRDREDEVRRRLDFADLGGLTTVDRPTYAWHARRATAGADAETLRRFGGSAEDYKPDTATAASWPGVIFLGSCDPAAQLAIAEAAPPGALLAADTMDIFIHDQRELVGRVLARSRILLGTLTELTLLAGGETEAPASLVMARFGLDCVVVKLGALGAELWTRTAIYELPAFPVAAVDPTGAGDALAGGFLGRLAQRLPADRRWLRDQEEAGLRGSELVEALRWGVVCASFAVEQPGLRGLETVTKERLLERMSQYQLTAEQEVS